MKQLRHTKAERDRFFRKHGEDFLGRTGRTRMIVEWEKSIALFSAVDADLEEHMRPQRHRQEITSEWIKRHLAEPLATAIAEVPNSPSNSPATAGRDASDE